MSENITFTRISDLPENVYGNNSSPIQNQMMMPPQQQPQQMSSQTTGFDQNTYQPMNIHPNPYGFPSPPPGGLPLPQQQMKPNQQMQNEMYMGTGSSHTEKGSEKYNGIEKYTGGSQQMLPSRDIPIDTSTYMHDDQIQANYIPQKKQTSDYILDYEETSAKNIQKYEKEKKKKRLLESWFDEIHIPVLIAILYFLFQLPIINTMIFRRFSFLAIYDVDGQFNLSGLVFKSALFGGCFYSMQKMMEILSEL
jgi:hypothetical protein